MGRLEDHAKQYAQDVRRIEGSMTAIAVDCSQRVTLLFRKGFFVRIAKLVKLERNISFKVGYAGTGVRCMHIFLTESGFDVSLPELEQLHAPVLLRRGRSKIQRFENDQQLAQAIVNEARAKTIEIVEL